MVLIKPCGFGLDQTMSEMEIIEQDVLSNVSAGTSVYVTDGNAFFNRPGPRLVESLEILAACAHPDLFKDFSSAHKLCITRL